MNFVIVLTRRLFFVSRSLNIFVSLAKQRQMKIFLRLVFYYLPSHSTWKIAGECAIISFTFNSALSRRKTMGAQTPTQHEVPYCFVPRTIEEEKHIMHANDETRRERKIRNLFSLSTNNGKFYTSMWSIFLMFRLRSRHKTTRKTQEFFITSRIYVKQYVIVKAARCEISSRFARFRSFVFPWE